MLVLARNVTDYISIHAPLRGATILSSGSCL